MAARSMTGFGAAERQGTAAKVRVELRTLNHRFLDVSLNLPSAFKDRETELKAMVAERVKRARVDVWISWEPLSDQEYDVRVNHKLLGELHRELEEARLAIGIAGDVGLDVLMRFPEAVRLEPRNLEGDAFADVQATLSEALSALDRARLGEGTALLADLAERFTRIGDLVEKAAATSECEPARVQERLRERLQALLGDAKLDPERLHQEVAFLAERSDVTEELVRLRAHLERARTLVRDEAEPGKPIDFLLQEIGREVNTLGSKSRSPEISGLVLSMKSEVEKIREQARNLE